MALTIFCDESGFSGNNLFLDKDRHFVYASVAISNDEAIDIVKKIRMDSGTKADELKFEKLGDKPRGREAVKWFLKEHGKKVGIFHADKKYATAGKFFECVFEPVLRPMKPLFYDILFHRFVSMFLFDAWACGDPVAIELLQDGQDLVRGKKKPHELTRLLREPLHLGGGDDPLTAVTAFSYAYRRGILRELDVVGTDPDLKRWAMDISNGALNETFHHWGDSGEEIEVICDDSKPLAASAELMRDIETQRMPEEWKGHFPERPILRMPKPVQFVDSKGTFVAIQLADLMAGAARFVLTEPKAPEAQDLIPLIETRFLKNCIFPQWEFIDADRRETVLNVQVLKELGHRARAGLDPNYAMERFIVEMAMMIQEDMANETHAEG
jgi:hypothetical protein